MVDIIALCGLTGITLKDTIGSIREIMKKPDADFKAFNSGIKKVVKAACKDYREYCKNSHEELHYSFLDKGCVNSIYQHILATLNENKPFSIDNLLPREHDLPDYERKLLFYFLNGYLKSSLEFCLRDFTAWSRQTEDELSLEVADVKNTIKRLEKTASELKDYIKRLPLGWQAQPVDYEWIQQRKGDAIKSCEAYKRDYYRVTGKQAILSGIICADLDCPNREAIEAANEILKKSDRHLIIIGNGGEGKTSLLFRLAVEYSKMGHLCFWMKLTRGEMSSTAYNDAKLLLNSINEQAMAQGTKAFLFVDNLYQGKNMLAALSEAWAHEHAIRLVTSERTMNMRELCSTNNNQMSVWLDNSEFLCFHSQTEASELKWMQVYKTVPVSLEWKIDVINNMITTEKDLDRDILNEAKEMVLHKAKSEVIPLVELMFMVIIEYNKKGKELNISKNILLDWDIWDTQIRNEFHHIVRDSFFYIAALYRIGLIVSATDFARYYRIEEHLFINFIERQYENRHNSPVEIINESDMIFISPKHDMIPDLYFSFNKDIDFNKFMDLWINAIPDDTDKFNKAFTSISLANWYYKNRISKMAEVQYVKTVTLYENAYGTEHLETAAVYSNIALVYNNKGESGKALEWYEKALRIREAVLGEEDFLTAILYNKIAMIYYGEKEYENALGWYINAFYAMRKCLGNHDSNVKVVLSNMYLTYIQSGRKEQNFREWLIERFNEKGFLR